ncbi:hypothetical protein BKA56DRAFT_583479 [Ilyonectria sp. MPI-CAGE-AT-0026]|nr:hypothetical protein BKA56DRAFT_583479 [Ilyonectria sp. MPI-CAGE-AT-0026]
MLARESCHRSWAVWFFFFSLQLRLSGIAGAGSSPRAINIPAAAIRRFVTRRAFPGVCALRRRCPEMQFASHILGAGGVASDVTS